MTSSLKASATSALKILAILATVTASCRFATSLFYGMHDACRLNFIFLFPRIFVGLLL